MVWVLCELNVWHQYVWLHLSTVGYLNTLGSEGMRITVLFECKADYKKMSKYRDSNKEDSE